MRQRMLLVVAAAIGVAACSKGEARASAQVRDVANAPQVVTVQAGDYYFTAPDTISSGMTTFRMAAGGSEFHHIVAVILEPGRKVSDLIEHFQTSHLFPRWAREVGGPNAVVPGDVSEATVDLKPGSYALVCVVPSKDGTRHVMKGMIRALTVVPRTGPNAPAPAADLVMTLSDYDFTMSPAISPGTRTIKFENIASQPHEAVIVQLAPGRTLEEMMQWLQTEEGPPPGRPLAGITFIAKGEVNYVTAEFTPGEYALICFIPDAGDGRPHFMHGMMKQFRVG